MNRTTARRARTGCASAGLAALALAALSGCSAGEQNPSAAGTTFSGSPASSAGAAASSTPMVGGMTECTKAALAESATGAARALGPDNVYTIDQLNCADGWAVTTGVLASKDNPQMGAPTSFIFEQEGQFWVLKDRADVCGTNPTTTTAPGDAQIPAALFLSGCAAG